MYGAPSFCVQPHILLKDTPLTPWARNAGYILEGAELAFYQRKMQKKGKAAKKE
jgi:hypothetical protein